MRFSRHAASLLVVAAAVRRRGSAYAFSSSRSLSRIHVAPARSGLQYKAAARCAITNLIPAAAAPRHASNNCRLYSTTDADGTVETSSISTSDLSYTSLALEHASIGKGGTYPNPAVGCVLVRHTTDNDGQDEAEVIGQGFHPAAGLPHAEVFALFEACGHVSDGVEAAKSVLPGQIKKADAKANDDLKDTVRSLLETYSSEDGPAKLFGGAFAGDDSRVTAYVTLEPCCHYGQTPPCALSLKEAGVDRVVVGFRDPNPRVDGGGVQLLRDAGVEVEIIDSANSLSEEDLVANNCADMVKSFAKRITPRSEEVDYDQLINGAKRRGLRSLKERLVSEGSMAEVAWPSKGTYLDTSDESADLKELAKEMQIDARWMENLDEMLWNNELVLMRLGNAIRKEKSPSEDKKVKSTDSSGDDIADELVLRKLGKAVSKKRGVKIVAERIALELGAHLAQVKGHTALLYRPGLPPKLDIDALLERPEAE